MSGRITKKQRIELELIKQDLFRAVKFMYRPDVEIGLRTELHLASNEPDYMSNDKQTIKLVNVTTTDLAGAVIALDKLKTFMDNVSERTS